MKVNITSRGRYHMFDLAKQMARLGYLNKLYTQYPPWMIEDPIRAKSETFFWNLIPSLMVQRLAPRNLRSKWRYIDRRNLDRWVASRLEPCDVFVWLSGSGLLSQEVAKRKYHALTVCDVGASHAQEWEALVSEECERWGWPYVPVDPQLMQRLLQEYEVCDLIVTPSTFVKQSFLKHGVPEHKVAVVPYGVDLSMFRQIPKEDDVFRVIYVGQMSLRKGIPYLLEAVAALNLPKFEVWLVGARLPETQRFFAQYSDKFRYMGVVPRSELYKYLSQASVFVLASIEEGLALVLAQAMACGLPIIATTNTGAMDLITDGVEGFIVPIRSPEAIRERIVYLYENPAVHSQMAQAALQRAQQMGSWELYGERMAAVYTQGLASLGTK